MGLVTSFNPRSRMGSDILGDIDAACDKLVSIHAPAWGATTQPTLTWTPWSSFNPRSRMGSDEYLPCLDD